MMRGDIKRIASDLAVNSHDLNFDILATYYLIFNYCKSKHTSPHDNTYTLNNGVLFINGEPVERVCPLIRPFNYGSEEADYYESLCIHDYN